MSLIFSLINIHNQTKNTSDYLEFKSRSLTKEKEKILGTKQPT